LTAVYGQPEQAALRIGRLSEGNPGAALELLGGEAEDSELSQRAIGFLLFKSLFLDSGPSTASHVVELLADKDRSQAEAILRLWQSLVRDCAHFASTDEIEQIVNSDFQSDIIAFSKYFDNPQLAPTFATAIKNALADIRLNVHIPTAIVALALKLGSAVRASR
jgi:hypothetical protein